MKALADMSLHELSHEQRAAQAQRQAAEYQEGLPAWRSAVNAAEARLRAVHAEIDARLAALRETQHGG